MLVNFAFLGLGLAPSVLIILGLLLILAFEIWMLVNTITNKHISNVARVWWIIGMVLIHPIVAIIYYFTDYQKTR